MKWPRPVGLVLFAAMTVVSTMPSETTTSRLATPLIGDTIKKLTNQLMDNSTALEITMDVRTPPKIKQKQQLNKMKQKEDLENSHAGVAIPVDEESLEVEGTTKKFNFYKIERPTTPNGLSTWILLSGQNSITTKAPPRKSVIKQPVDNNLKGNGTTLYAERPHRIVKPIFKKRPTTITTTLSTTASITTPTPTGKHRTTTAETTTQKAIKESTKLTKVKASILNNAVNHKNNSTTTKTLNTLGSTTEQTLSHTSTDLATKKNVSTTPVPLSNLNKLPAEAKEGDANLDDTKKKKQTTNKRKKNKNRRRKPSDTNSTSIAKPSKISKEKPIGTQLYNYLSREIMPTVGVGLVGLMVTAGLASYFLYPFGIAKRSDIDRKDKDGSYYYHNLYSSGMPEEEAIGKVIAGMPENSLFGNSYKTPSARNTYPNVKYRLVDRKVQIQPQKYSGMVQGTVENVPLNPKQQEETSYDLNNYKREEQPNLSFSDQKFVVGNIPKDIPNEVSPVTVPEHGPRNLNLNLRENITEEPKFVVGNVPKEVLEDQIKSNILPSFGPRRRNLKIRRRRSEDINNELDSMLDKEETTSSDYITTVVVDSTTIFESFTKNQQQSEKTTEKPKSSTIKLTTTSESGTTTTPATSLPDKFVSFVDMMRELIHLKVKVGLEVIQNATQSLSKYVSRVQSRLNQHYDEYKQKG